MSTNSDLPKRVSIGAAASYKQIIEGHRNVLHEVAKSALSLPGIPEHEKKFLEIEIHNLSGIDQLVAIIDKNLNGVNRTAALSSLERAIFATLVIGSRAFKNPVSGKLRTKGAASILAARSKHLDSLVEKHVKIVLQKHPSLTANAITNRILVPVNEELKKIPKPLTAAEKKMNPPPEPREKAAKPDAIRGRVTKILSKIRKEAA